MSVKSILKILLLSFFLVKFYMFLDTQSVQTEEASARYFTSSFSRRFLDPLQQA